MDTQQIEAILSALLDDRPVMPTAEFGFFFANLPNDASVQVVGTINVSQNHTYYVKETITGRNALGNVITATRRITVQGGSVPVLIADSNDAGSVSTMPGGVVTFSSGIVGTNLELRASNSALATSTPNVTIYAEIFVCP